MVILFRVDWKRRSLGSATPCGHALFDPDGYRLEFERPTDTPEETKLSELKS